LIVGNVAYLQAHLSKQPEIILHHLSSEASLLDNPETGGRKMSIKTFGRNWDAWTPELGKFEGEGPATEWFYLASLDWREPYIGNMSDLGWVATPFEIDDDLRAQMPPCVLSDVNGCVAVIAHENDPGFVSLSRYETMDKFNKVVAELKGDAKSSYVTNPL
jgi:hypothetical protein